MKNSVLFVAALALLVLAGCDGKVNLKGKVVFSDDGSPVPMGTVVLETDTYVARGTIKPDGTFTVGSEKQTDGLPTGTYNVHITGAQKTIGVQKGSQLPVFELLIDEKYTNRMTSGLTIDVTQSTKFFEIKVDRFDTTKKRQGLPLPGNIVPVDGAEAPGVPTFVPPVQLPRG